MAYVALKPCTFAGQSFRIGDIISDELIHPENVKNLIAMQVISDVGTVNENDETIVIPAPTLSFIVRTEDREITVEPTDEGIQDVFNVLIGKTTDAEAIINQMTDEDALVLLHLADSRKSVKAAAEARAKSLMESAGEQ